MSPPDDDLSFHSAPTEGATGFVARNAEAANLEEIREMLEHTRNNLTRTQRRIERNERQAETTSRQMMALWVLVVMLIVGFGLLTWYLVLLQRKP